ncbi:hypothetical protein S140_55 [Shewanella sp. phage 1/40]|uniref:hypothetical protein n=1 Tax=Shewanella sp. phage 1/40 TaxID=1458860 RepID=UPI0004F839BB|nr:hypothetical protein S140_55 [Shewanella sp. phage 1/40]AHK11465.1 hypothetical protein S140_55 [Shewanella sp. phage 1/40]
MNKDREKLYTALSLWINHIETGDVNTSKDDMLRLCSGDRDIKRITSRFPTLSREQESYLKDLRDLQHKIIMGGEI